LHFYTDLAEDNIESDRLEVEICIIIIITIIIIIISLIGQLTKGNHVNQ